MTRPVALWTAFLLLWGGSLLWNGGVSAWAAPLTALGMTLLYAASLRLLKDEPLRIGRAPWIWIHVLLVLLLIPLLPALPLLFPETARWRAQHGVGAWPAAADAVYGLRTTALIQSYLLAGLFTMRLRQAGLPTGTLVGGLLALLGLEAVYGLGQQFGGLATVPFFGPRAAPDSASGTLVGRNNFAGLMAVALVLASSRAYARFAWPLRRSDDAGKAGWSRRLEGGLGWALLAALFAVAIVASKSRGGTLAALGGLLLLPLFHRGRAAAAGLAGLGGLLAVGIFVADPTGLAARFSTLDPFEPSGDLRWQIAKATSAAALKQPLLGFGWGAHPTAFHPFQPVTMPGQIQHAHNEYVNVLFEAGFPGLLLLLAGLGLWFVRVWRAQRPLPGPDRMPVAAAMAGIAVLAIHAFVDFDLRIPSIGWLAGVLFGLGAAAVRGGEARPAWPPALAGVAFALGAVALLQLPREPRTEAEARAVLRASPYDHRAAWALARATGEPQRFGAAADLFPAHADLQREAGLIFWDNGMKDAAARCLHRLFEQEPSALGAVLEELFDTDVPGAQMEALIPPLPRPRALFAGELVRRGRWKEGHDYFLKHVPESAEHARDFDAFADRLREAGQWGLEAALRERRLRAASDAPAHAAAAAAWLKLQVYDRALERITFALRIDPATAAWDGLKGGILAAKGARLEAIEAYTAAKTKDPSNVEWVLQRGLLALDERLHEAAAGDLREVLRSRPDDRRTRFGLARAEAGLGRKDTALILLEEWLQRHPEDAEARALRDSLRR